MLLELTGRGKIVLSFDVLHERVGDNKFHRNESIVNDQMWPTFDVFTLNA